MFFRHRVYPIVRFLTLVRNYLLTMRVFFSCRQFLSISFGHFVLVVSWKQKGRQQRYILPEQVWAASFTFPQESPCWAAAGCLSHLPSATWLPPCLLKMAGLWQKVSKVHFWGKHDMDRNPLIWLFIYSCNRICWHIPLLILAIRAIYGQIYNLTRKGWKPQQWREVCLSAVRASAQSTSMALKCKWLLSPEEKPLPVFATLAMEDSPCNVIGYEDYTHKCLFSCDL